MILKEIKAIHFRKRDSQEEEKVQMIVQNDLRHHKQMKKLLEDSRDKYLKILNMNCKKPKSKCQNNRSRRNRFLHQNT